MSKQKWEVKSQTYGTGEDYDGYWEVVNERGDGIRTKDDYDDIEKDLQKIADAINSFDGKFNVETSLEINLHCETQLQKMEIETLKAENSKMRQALEWYADAGNYLGDNGELATAWKQNENIKNKAAEAIKSPNV